jgi:CRP/FNR family cyclic AMP-dependent transcriptional regulator
MAIQEQSAADGAPSPFSPGLQALAERGELRHYRRNTLIIQEGDVGDTLFIILAGRLKAFSLGAKDREITFGIYGPGEYVGEMSLDGGPRSASVITLEPTVCTVVTRHTIKQHIAQHPDFALELLAKVIRRARLATRDARNMALLDAYGRLVRLLDELAVPQEDGTRVIPMELTHLEIASRTGCSREMISRLMKDLDNGAYLQRDGSRRIVLVRPLPPRW